MKIGTSTVKTLTNAKTAQEAIEHALAVIPNTEERKAVEYIIEVVYVNNNAYRDYAFSADKMLQAIKRFDRHERMNLEIKSVLVGRNNQVISRFTK